MNKKTKKTFIIVISFAAVIFLVLNVFWFTYRYNYFAKVVNDNSNCIEIPSKGHKTYNLTPDRNQSINDFSVYVSFPEYLKFTGNYNVSQAVYMNDDGSGYLNDYYVSLSIRPHLFKEMDFSVEFRDYTKNGMQSYIFDIDKNSEVTKIYNLDPNEILNNPDAKALIDKAMETAEKYLGDD